MVSDKLAKKFAYWHGKRPLAKIGMSRSVKLASGFISKQQIKRE
jgi:hypothetical protein